jgi:hypothetical protein
MIWRQLGPGCRLWRPLQWTVIRYKCAAMLSIHC